MYLEEIINHFDGVKKTGSNQYSCKCPAHKDKSNSLGITSDGDRILMNCFAGCSIKSILDASGLNWKDIMPSKEPDKYVPKLGFNPYSILKMLQDEVLIVGLSSSDIKKGKALSDEDHERLLTAVANIRRAYGYAK
jgi:hypothetical protein